MGFAKSQKPWFHGILFLKLFWPSVRKNCSSDREQLLKFEAEGRKFAKFLISLVQSKLLFVQRVKQFLKQNTFLITYFGRFLRSITLEPLEKIIEV